MSGTLYLVSSPIGNLGDITQRAIETLKKVDLIASEDTRVTKKLLSHFDIKTLLESYHDHSSPKKREKLIRFLIEGKDIALISDAGTPLINDPGYKLVQESLDKGIEITALPGPCSVINALVLSGLPTDTFTFLGYLPMKDGKKRKLLQKFQEREQTLIFLESPYRVLKSLQVVREVFNKVHIAVCREMTKKFEEIFRGTAEEAIEHFSKKQPKGEFTIVISGKY